MALQQWGLEDIFAEAKSNKIGNTTLPSTNKRGFETESREKKRNAILPEGTIADPALAQVLGRCRLADQFLDLRVYIQRLIWVEVPSRELVGDSVQDCHRPLIELLRLHICFA